MTLGNRYGIFCLIVFFIFYLFLYTTQVCLDGWWSSIDAF